MSTPTAFEALRAKQKAAQEAESERAKAASESREREKQAMFKEILEALRPYVHCNLDGLRVEVRTDGEVANVYVEGDHYLTFRPERYWSGCHCDGPCDCKPNTWLTLRAIQHRGPKEGDDLYCYFPVSVNEISNPEKFAEGMAKMMDEYWNTKLAEGKKRP